MRFLYDNPLCNIRHGASDALQALWSTLTVSLVDANRTHCDTSWGDGQTYNDPFGRLYWLQAGEAMVHHHGRKFHLTPGALYVIPAHSPSQYLCPRWMDLRWLHFTADVFVGIDLFALLNGPYAIPLPDAGWMDGQWDRLLARCREDTPGSRFEVESIVRQLLALFLDHADPGVQAMRLQGMAQFHMVLSVIEERLPEKITLAELAEVAHLHPTYFSNLFSRYVGEGPLIYVNRRRVERAKGLLQHTEASLREVAQAVGFCDEFYFSRVFKQFTRLSPGQYRHQRTSRMP